MRRTSTALLAGTIVAAALLAHGGRVSAQTATTTTTTTATTTTTTIPPHPFSPATASCVKQAQRSQRACKQGGTAQATCRSQYETAFSNCFAAGAGVSCAKKCVTKETSCLTGAPATQKKCNQTCKTNRKNDVKACRQIADGDNIWAGGDASCLATADANFHLCQFVCAQTVADCGTSLKFCVANCQNL